MKAFTPETRVHSTLVANGSEWREPVRALVRWLYRLARLSRDVEVLASGDPARVGRRLVNKMLGRNVVHRVWWRPARRRGEPR